jgi:hypothetical protein
MTTRQPRSGQPAALQPGSAQETIARLANLAAYWDELAVDQQGIADLFADRDPAQSCVARGRSRQLTDCADQLRALSGMNIEACTRADAAETRTR